MSTITQVSTIDADLYEQVREHVAKANARASKIGVPGYTITRAPADDRPIRSWDDSLGAWKIVGYVTQVEVTVTGETPKIEGWEFVGSLDWDDVSGECVVRAVPGLELDLGDHRPRAQFCDHCQTSRYRKATFLLRHEHGAFTQVGSTCIQDFLGVKVNVDLVGFNPYEDCDSTNRYTPERVVIEEVFADGLALIRSLGWVSAGDARGTDKISTRVRLESAWFDRRESGLGQPAYPGEQAREAIAKGRRDGDDTLAAEILRWVREDLSGSSDYVENLRAAVAASEVLPVRNYNPLTGEWEPTGETYVSNTCRLDNLGLVVSAVSVYQREQERQAERAAEQAIQGTSVHVGAVKERLRGLTGVVTSVRTFENEWGTSVLVVFRTDEGNVFKTFSSADALFEVEAGQRISLDGTVKKHETFNGLDSTVLTRCTVKEVVDA